MTGRQHVPCQLHHEAPGCRVVLEAPLWPNDLRHFAGHHLCVHVALPRERARWYGLFAGVRLLAARTAHLVVHVPPERGEFSLDPAVLLASWGRRHQDRLATVLGDAAARGVELTPQQVRVESPAVTRSALHLPSFTAHTRAWGVVSVAWFPAANSGISPIDPAGTHTHAGLSKEVPDGLP